MVTPNSFRANGGSRPPAQITLVIKIIARVECGIADKFKSASVDLVRPGLRNHIDEPRRTVPDLSRHYSRAGLHFLNRIHIEVLRNVAPPSSGSVVSAPSMAKTDAVPRCPFTANCCVKLAAPFVSVIVPAASSSNLLKSRSFRGRLETSPLVRCSPPLPCGAPAFLWALSRGATRRVCPCSELVRSALSVSPSLMIRRSPAVHTLPFTLSVTV